MNQVFLYFASGESFYPGAVLLLATIALGQPSYSWVFRLRNIAAWIALALIIMASAPFDWAIEVGFLALFAIWYFVSNSIACPRPFRITTASTLAVLLVLGVVSELSYRRIPTVAGSLNNRLVVIGDSISAGLGQDGATWPMLFQQVADVQVSNLAQPGATSADAIEQAGKVSTEQQLILIEIGGNDLIAGISPTKFERSLNLILQKLVAPRRTIVMFELPLIPTRLAYGRVQRRLAANYGVWLIPKRCFARVISGADATSDGLHLSAIGAQRMSALVARVLWPVLNQRTHSEG
jgi:lysophospholipase L1-like esterase